MSLALNFARAWIGARVRSDRAAALVEYALLTAMIAMATLATVNAVGDRVAADFQSITAQI